MSRRCKYGGSTLDSNDHRRRSLTRALRPTALAIAFLLIATVVTPGVGAQPESEPAVEVPEKPDGLVVSAEAGSLSVALDWDDTEGADHYLVRWRAAGPGNRLNEGVETATSDSTIEVSAAGEYVVRIEACNSAGCGPPLAKRFHGRSSSRAAAGAGAGA